MMKPIMHEVRVAPYKLSWKLAQVRLPETSATRREPTTPSVAASVAVATPV
jgi:hypothetical protein